ncbi:hypothetical protein IE077_001350 [Cardiosporidium cionae]|uniref:Uncharacterized protein n=1 Tax=Cardiosporidium cionae TaxID=476202 RepID=A0ABQ7JD38_9APIC|nr:hypothetical protein IE077_001350 [Cardiosporidium cionae]|eukprot:KAF8821937.1 hypothetical protein IE077_001350 [Cardiosporidium cionae]
MFVTYCSRQTQLPVLARDSSLPITRTVGDDGAVTIRVKGSRVMKWDIPIFNGWLHVLESVPLSEKIPLSSAILWDCLNNFCLNCPKKGTLILKYLDKFGVIPTSPTSFEAPPGIRPNWVCQSAEGWFPAGVPQREYEKHTNFMHGKSSSNEEKSAADYIFKRSVQAGRVEIHKNYQDIIHNSYSSKLRRKKMDALVFKGQALMNWMDRAAARGVVTECFDFNVVW